MYQENTTTFQEELAKLTYTLDLIAIAQESLDTPHKGDAEINQARYESLLFKFEDKISSLLVTYITSLQDEMIETEEDQEAAYEFVRKIIVALLPNLRCPVCK